MFTGPVFQIKLHVLSNILLSGFESSPEACSAPRHYLNHCWLIVNGTLTNKLQWHFYRNSIVFIEEYTFENFPVELSMGRFVNVFNIKTDLIRLICDTGQVLMTLFSEHSKHCTRVWENTLPIYVASRWLCYLSIAIPTSQGMPTNMIEISHLLPVLIASTECVQYGFCRRILTSVLGALVMYRHSIWYDTAQKWLKQSINKS